MTPKRFWFKRKVLEYSIFPQLPSFCGIAACCGAVSCILDQQITEEMMHVRYGIGLYTKLKAPATYLPEQFASLARSGPGISNWDVIRLCNSVLLDEGRNPSAVLLCGEDFVRESEDRRQRERLFAWLEHDSCQAIVHTVNHYTLVAGARSTLDGDHYLLLADSARRSGPLRSLALRDLITLAAQDERYGFVLVSDRNLEPDVFGRWTSAMTPPEVTEVQRFERIDKS